jgi:hypothetical protein
MAASSLAAGSPWRSDMREEVDVEILVLLVIGSTLWRAVVGVNLEVLRTRRPRRVAAAGPRPGDGDGPRPWHPSMRL